MEETFSDILDPKICYNCHKKGHTKHNCRRQSLSKLQPKSKRIESDINSHLVIEGIDLRDGLNPFEVLKSILNIIKLTTINHTDVFFKLRTFDKRLFRSDEIVVIFHQIQARKKVLDGLRQAGLNFFSPTSINFDILIEVNMNKKLYKLRLRHDISYEINKYYNKILRLQAKYGTLHLSLGMNCVVVRKYLYLFCINDDKVLNFLKELLKRKSRELQRKCFSIKS